MRTEPAQPPLPGPTTAARTVRRLFGIVAVVAVALVGASCSGAGPTLEPADGQNLDGEAESSSAAERAASAPDTATMDVASAPSPVEGKPVLVGVLLDTTNMMATTDRQPGVAFVEAIERIGNAEGLDGRPVEVRWINTTSRMSVVDAEAAELIDDGADLLVVTCELDIARPAINRAVEAGVLVVSPCGPEAAWGTGELGPTVFSMMPTVEALGAVMAEHVWAEGHREVSVVVDETGPEPRGECRGFRDRWRALGGRVAAEFAVNLVTAEALAQDSGRLEELQADALVLCSFSRVAAAVLESVRGQGLRVPIIAGPALDTGVWVPDDVDAPLRDFTMLTLASTAGDDPVAAVLAAAAEFLVADGVPPNSGRFVLGADLAEAYRTAVDRAGTTDGVRVADAWRAMVDEPLVSGQVTFEGRQAPSSWPLRVMRHQSGVFVNDGVVVARAAQ